MTFSELRMSYITKLVGTHTYNTYTVVHFHARRNQMKRKYRIQY